MRLRSLVCLSLVLASETGVLAQISAVCLPGWEWNQNSLGQDPCTVGSMLDAACFGQPGFTYDKLEPGQFYTRPAKNQPGTLRCDCNTVVYSVRMACTTCQQGSAYDWSTYVNDCTGVYVSEYPGDIPQGTAVPHWAYFNVTALDEELYTDDNAQNVGRDPEVLPPVLNTTSSGVPSATGGLNDKSSGSKTGAIVGGVVGGVTGLIIIAIIIFFLVRRGRKKRDILEPQPQYQYKESPADYWNSPPGSPTYNNAPFKPNRAGEPPMLQPSIHTDQGDENPAQPPITYVTRFSNYGGGR